MGDAATKGRQFRFRLDPASGIPVYRQIMDQVTAAISSGALMPGDQLPTVRQLAVDLSVNPNTVIRAYRELEIRGILDTQQGSGTFISRKEIQRDDLEHARILDQFVADVLARAGAAGLSAADVLARLQEFVVTSPQTKEEQ